MAYLRVSSSSSSFSFLHHPLLALLLLLPLLPQCPAPGAHKFGVRSGRDLWSRCSPNGGCAARDEAEAALLETVANAAPEERELIGACMNECYDAESECPECFANCVGKCTRPGQE